MKKLIFGIFCGIMCIVCPLSCEKINYTPISMDEIVEMIGYIPN